MVSAPAPQPVAPIPPWTLQAPAAGVVPSSPAARIRAKQLGLDLANLKGSGPGGAIVLADVEALERVGRRSAQRHAARAAEVDPGVGHAVVRPVAPDVDGSDARSRGALHLAGVTPGVAVGVHPDRNPVQFAAGQPTVAIVVEGCQRRVAVTPPDPPRPPAEEVAARRHVAVAVRVPDQDADVSVHPRPTLGDAVSEVKLEVCCDKCLAKVEKAPGKYLAKAAETDAGKCIISGRSASDNAKVSIGFCCGKCKTKFDADPKAFLGKVKAAGKEKKKKKS